MKPAMQFCTGMRALVRLIGNDSRGMPNTKHVRNGQGRHQRPPESEGTVVARLNKRNGGSQRGPPNMERLRVTTANCGGLGTDPRKVPRLIAHPVCAEPDVVHLQELGPAFTPAWLAVGVAESQLCCGLGICKAGHLRPRAPLNMGPPFVHTALECRMRGPPSKQRVVLPQGPPLYNAQT